MDHEPVAAAAPAVSAEVQASKDAKAAAKKAEKEAKKLKALQKKEAASAKPVGGENSKKAQAKAEAKAKAEAEAAQVEKLIDAVRATVAGEKKDVGLEAPKGYSPKYVEAAWYSWWTQCGYFKPEDNSEKEPFVIVIPPPNVTGALHIGHALTNAVQDCIVRYQRMKGKNVLWVPGTDHAGIATQTVVEKKIGREDGLTRHDLGREKFVETVWAWVEEYGQRIWNQQQRMGISVDWDRQAFTMDAQCSKAVLEAFVRFHKDGLIYRENRLVNWCCELRTAVSDIEVDYIELEGATGVAVPGYSEPVECGVIISFAYPIEDSEEEVVVATTRIETMLGDTAVAVHPEDPRYTHLHGKFAVHPVSGRRIPIILDAELVEMDFGTGAVKITPAHDPNDNKAGKRHNLPEINVFTDNGLVNEHGGPFEGQKRFECRKTIVTFLTEKGLYRGKVDNKMSLPICSRSKDIIEPILKPQWWVNCQGMAADACGAVRDGSLEIIPRDFEATWFRWLENVRDWCISRQLWWGHRIPAFYVVLGGETHEESGLPGGPSEQSDRWVVGRNEAEAREVAAAKFPGQEFTLEQDEDVLDTWFSSGIFPFSVMGWPDATPDLQAFYPGALLETGHDILFFWVARMVMMGMKLTNQVPFKQVYLHAMVRDAHGRKMSKSLGNVIDPINVIDGISLEGLHATVTGGNLDPREAEKAVAGQKADYPDGIEECGTDALRFALCAYTAQGRDINLDIKRVVAYRHWCNKLWNAIRFAMMRLGDGFAPAEHSDRASANLPFVCTWILSRLHSTCASVNPGMDAYDFSSTTQAIYAFWQYDICDCFIELIKPVMQGDDERAKAACRQTLYTVLEAGLRLLHPFMPFVTEELWQRLPRRAGEAAPSIMLASYPTAEWVDSVNTDAEAAMAEVQTIVTRARAQRTASSLTRQAPGMFISCKDPDAAARILARCPEIIRLTGNGMCTVMAAGESAPPTCAVEVVDANTSIYLDLAGILDPAVEVEKLSAQEQTVVQKLEAAKQKMGQATYASTPAEIQEREAAKRQDLELELENLRKAMASMQALIQ